MYIVYVIYIRYIRYIPIPKMNYRLRKFSFLEVFDASCVEKQNLWRAVLEMETARFRRILGTFSRSFEHPEVRTCTCSFTNRFCTPTDTPKHCVSLGVPTGGSSLSLLYARVVW